MLVATSWAIGWRTHEINISVSTFILGKNRDHQLPCCQELRGCGRIGEKVEFPYSSTGNRRGQAVKDAECEKTIQTLGWADLRDMWDKIQNVQGDGLGLRQSLQISGPSDVPT